MPHKLLKRGAPALGVDAVLEVLHLAFTPRRDVKPVAKTLEARLQSLSALLTATAEDLVKVGGVGEPGAAI